MHSLGQVTVTVSLGIRVNGLGFRVEGLGIRVLDAGLAETRPRLEFRL